MKIPKGKLIAIGGNEVKDNRKKGDKNIDFNKGILQEIIAEIGNPKPVIQVLPFASAQQEEMMSAYIDAFKKLGHDIEVMIIKSKEALDKSENLDKIMKADGIFITGGDQGRLKKMLEGTVMLEYMKKRYEKEDFVIAGTSAGAMIMSEFMIDPGGTEESVLKNMVKLSDGLGFLPRTIIDTHFLERGRFPRLAESLLKKKKVTGIGLSEDTAIIVTEGNRLRTIGSGTVTIMEIDEKGDTNYNEIKDKDPVYIENLKVHILSRGAAYLLREKQFIVL